MNLRSFVSIELEKNGRVYSYLMPVGAPYGEAYDAAFEICQNILDMAKKASEGAKRQDDIAVEDTPAS
jgi:hypothetical protein